MEKIKKIVAKLANKINSPEVVELELKKVLCEGITIGVQNKGKIFRDPIMKNKNGYVLKLHETCKVGQTISYYVCENMYILTDCEKINHATVFFHKEYAETLCEHVNENYTELHATVKKVAFIEHPDYAKFLRIEKLKIS